MVDKIINRIKRIRSILILSEIAQSSDWMGLSEISHNVSKTLSNTSYECILLHAAHILDKKVINRKSYYKINSEFEHSVYYNVLTGSTNDIIESKYNGIWNQFFKNELNHVIYINMIKYLIRNEGCIVTEFKTFFTWKELKIMKEQNIITVQKSYHMKAVKFIFFTDEFKQSDLYAMVRLIL